MLKRLAKRWKYRLRANSPRVLFAKAVTLPRIRKWPPISVPEEGECEIHALVSKRDFLMLLWSLYSFYHTAGPRFPLLVHDDGSLTERHAVQLAQLFPGSRLITRAESDRDLERALARYPRCLRLRTKDKLSLKVFDFFHYGTAPGILLTDSDVLFFKAPTELIDCAHRQQRNVFNRDPWSNYVIPTSEMQTAFGMAVPERINIGLGVMRRDACDLARAEKILAHDAVAGAPYLVDQTVLAILAASQPVGLLEAEYAVTLKPGTNGLVTKHYTRLVRHLFYTEGVPLVRALVGR
jgi:hypothetical protein